MKFTICKGKHSSFKSARKHTKVVKRRNFKKIKVDVEVLPESVYPTYNDADLLNDWNKFPGVSGFIWPSNKTFATLGFRTNAEGNLEVTPYANLNSAVNEKFPAETSELITIFEPGVFFSYEIELQDANLVVSLFSQDTLLDSHAFETKSIGRYMRTTSLWFGGYDNDNNNLGGVAPSNISFNFKHTITYI